MRLRAGLFSNEQLLRSALQSIHKGLDVEQIDLVVTIQISFKLKLTARQQIYKWTDVQQIHYTVEIDAAKQNVLLALKTQLQQFAG